MSSLNYYIYGGQIVGAGQFNRTGVMALRP